MRRWNSLWDAEPLFLAPAYYDLLLGLLRCYVSDRTVWAFGSRATGKYLGRFSDLDLAVERRLPRDIRNDLLDALDESDLPIKVDLVELETADPAFVERIRRDFVPVHTAVPVPEDLPSAPKPLTSHNPH